MRPGDGHLMIESAALDPDFQGCGLGRRETIPDGRTIMHVGKRLNP